MNAEEPVSNAGWLHMLAGIIAMLAGKYAPAIGVTDEQALVIAGLIFAGASKLITMTTRSKVVSVAKLARVQPANEHQALMAALKRPS